MARTKLIVVGAVAVVAGLTYWFGPQHLVVDRRVNEAPPPVSADTGGDTTLSSGEFRSLEHETSGVAVVIGAEDGTRFLRIEDLDTSSGPDLRVYLSGSPADGPEQALDDVFVDLGGLKGNQGDQNYEIPTEVDLEDYESVSIWCRRFSVGFGVAPLTS